MLTKIPHGLDEIVTSFGELDDPRFEQKHLAMFALPYPLLYAGQPVMKARAHKKAVDHFILAFRAVDDAGLADTFREYNGIYNRRSIRGRPSHPSLHSYGVAIDMGASTHPLGKFAPWPKTILDAFKAAGFFWGGDFRSRKDCMHWQLATGY